MEDSRSDASPATGFPDDLYQSPSSAAADAKSPESDVQILTSGGLRIPAHSTVLASASTVFETILDQPREDRRSDIVIPVNGVPCDAVSAFLGFLYSHRSTEEEMEKYGMHLLALSHVFLVPQLKQRCSKALIGRLSVENVVDVLQLARLCDAPDLYLKCMQLVSTSFKAVARTEGWSFLQDHDPWLELQILKFIDEAESRKTMTRKQREDRRLFLELSEAMECLEHICKEGCVHVGPYSAKRRRGPCGKFGTCEGLQKLFLHFGSCKRRVKGGRCPRCKSMWRLLRLHSSICDQPDRTCRVPLCRQFKAKVEHQEKRRGDDGRWKVLARKVVSAKAFSSLSSAAKRKRDLALVGRASGNGIPNLAL